MTPMECTTNEATAWKSEQALSWLRRIRADHLLTVAMQDEIDVLRSMALSGQDTTREKVNVSGGDRMPDIVQRIIDLTGELDAQMREMLDAREDAHKRLMELDPRYAAVLTLYYVDGNTWAAVACKTHYEVETCMRLRTEALPYVYEVMPRECRTMIPRAD